MITLHISEFGARNVFVHGLTVRVRVICNSPPLTTDKQADNDGVVLDSGARSQPWKMAVPQELTEVGPTIKLACFAPIFSELGVCPPT